jgi:hypothetical protein
MLQMRVSGTEVDSPGFRIQAVGERVAYRINATARTPVRSRRVQLA